MYGLIFVHEYTHMYQHKTVHWYTHVYQHKITYKYTHVHQQEHALSLVYIIIRVYFGGSQFSELELCSRTELVHARVQDHARVRSDHISKKPNLKILKSQLKFLIFCTCSKYQFF